LLLLLLLPQGTARMHVAACHPSDELPVQRHTMFYRRHPPGHAVLVTNLPLLGDAEVRERIKQLFSDYSLRPDAVFTDKRVSCHTSACQHPSSAPCGQHHAVYLKAAHDSSALVLQTMHVTTCHIHGSQHC
jgi:hypothetical protein